EMQKNCHKAQRSKRVSGILPRSPATVRGSRPRKASKPMSRATGGARVGGIVPSRSTRTILTPDHHASHPGLVMRPESENHTGAETMSTKHVYVIEGVDDGVGSGWSTDSIGGYVEFGSREEAES